MPGYLHLRLRQWNRCYQKIRNDKIEEASESKATGTAYLCDVPSLKSPSFSSSETALLPAPLTLLAARDEAGVFNFECPGVDSLERALRDRVLPLSMRAFFRKSCILRCVKGRLIVWLGYAFLGVAQIPGVELWIGRMQYVKF